MTKICYFAILHQKAAAYYYEETQHYLKGDDIKNAIICQRLVKFHSDKAMSYLNTLIYDY